MPFATLIAIALMQGAPPRIYLDHFGRPEAQTLRHAIDCQAYRMSIDVVSIRGKVALRRPATYPGKRYHDQFSELDAALSNIREFRGIGGTCYGGNPYFTIRGYSAITGKLTAVTIESWEGKISGFKVTDVPD